jgi:hypothetical protein
MEPISLKLVFVDGTEKSVLAIAADLIAFEQHFDKSVATLQNDVRLTYLFWICWHVLHRKGETKDDFDKFIETVSGVSVGDDQKK